MSKMDRKWMAALLAALGVSVCAAGCGKKEEPEPEPPVIEDTAAEEPETESDVEAEIVVDEPEEESHEGEALSPLTGMWIDEEIAKQRPVSCMIGNTDTALPQYGVGEADIIYEAPVEGSLTRLMGIFQDYKDLKQLGSVRSCRLYYAYYSMGFDAIYLHYGQASYATGFLESGQIDDLNGLEYEVDRAVIYRDNTKKAPHNAYATGKGLVDGIALKGYETAYEAEGTHYQFAAEDEPVVLEGPDSLTANIVQPGYRINKPWFEYNAKDGLYYRYQYGDKHIDGTTNEQLAVTNILLQDSNVRTLDDNGYLEVDTAGEGSGYYITGGRAIPVTWKCEDHFSPTHYYDGEGNEITLNPGKTWVCIIDNDHTDEVHFSEDASQMQ